MLVGTIIGNSELYLLHKRPTTTTTSSLHSTRATIPLATSTDRATTTSKINPELYSRRNLSHSEIQHSTCLRGRSRRCLHPITQSTTALMATTTAMETATASTPKGVIEMAAIINSQINCVLTSSTISRRVQLT